MRYHRDVLGPVVCEVNRTQVVNVLFILLVSWYLLPTHSLMGVVWCVIKLVQCNLLYGEILRISLKHRRDAYKHSHTQTHTHSHTHIHTHTHTNTQTLTPTHTLSHRNRNLNNAGAQLNGRVLKMYAIQFQQNLSTRKAYFFQLNIE